jgi:YD repeat-containing protein
VTTGARTSEFEYFATSDGKNGYLASSIDPMGQVSSQEPDALGRPLSTTTAATTTYFDWDAAGNLTGVTPPGKPEHEQTYTAVDNLASYVPPPTADVSSPATTYTYNLDWQPTSETRPDGVTITKTYDSAGRLSQQIAPTGTKTSSYYPAGASGPGVAPGKLSGIEGPTAVNLAYSYDGSLLTATTWSGDVEGVVSFGYDNNFWKVSEVVTGATGSHAATFGYDADGLVVCVSPTTCPGSGALSFSRHSGNGMVTSATSGLLTETHSVSAYGEPARHVVADGTTTLYDLTLDSTLFPRDPLGRIVRKTEVVLGTTRASDYTYDVLGRLTDVVVNDTASEHYEYDPNGNRLRGVVTRDGVTTDWTGTYDAQDRLLSYGLCPSPTRPMVSC